MPIDLGKADLNDCSLYLIEKIPELIFRFQNKERRWKSDDKLMIFVCFNPAKIASFSKNEALYFYVCQVSELKNTNSRIYDIMASVKTNLKPKCYAEFVTELENISGLSYSEFQDDLIQGISDCISEECNLDWNLPSGISPDIYRQNQAYVIQY